MNVDPQSISGLMPSSFCADTGRTMTIPAPLAHEDAQSSGVGDHIDAYIEHCRRSGHAPRHVAQKRSHLRKFAKESRVRSLDEITAETLLENISAMRTRGKRGNSARTCNWRRSIVVSFMNWCVQDRRIAEHNTAATPKYDESDDQRRIRRALTDDECGRLLEIADAISAHRGLWYRLALEVGLRRGELARLRWIDVDLDSRVLTVNGSKAKRRDVVPLLGDTAERLASLRPAAFAPSDRVFPVAVSDAERRADFASAGIAETDALGRVADLHSLRTTLGTRLARRGVAPQIAQRIMRHSSYETTLRHYTDLRIDDMRRAMRGATRHEHAPDSVLAWLERCPIPLSDPHRRAIAALLSAA
jgi:integrase